MLAYSVNPSSQLASTGINDPIGWDAPLFPSRGESQVLPVFSTDHAGGRERTVFPKNCCCPKLH